MSSIQKTLKYRLYTNRGNKHLNQTIDCAGIAWNKMIALQRRYYRRYQGYINKFRLMKHMSKLRRSDSRSSYLKKLDAQALQGICKRLDLSYQAFFKWVKTREGSRKGKPQFKKVKKYKSFTLKQASWKFLGNNKIKLGQYVYKFSKSREVQCYKNRYR